ncbi:hypothetical protein [Streptomyces sp. GESEQ-4]|uniref:hypothetical protein n=1 Tax=Streptomyces sp. GESEQ-4 TaxID=2812655 RepID=UPI001B340504|nr:hypothetical protein [Streptomyces sp. GESEQ-4]
MTLSRVKYGAAMAVAAVTVTMFAAAPATAADSKTWTRYCGGDTRTYTAKVSDHEATTKRNSGDCAGLAYVRIKVQGSWGTWASSSGTAKRLSPVYEIEASQHKDCNCSTANIYTLYP